jgi:hypothetical protein
LSIPLSVENTITLLAGGTAWIGFTSAVGDQSQNPPLSTVISNWNYQFCTFFLFF